MRQSSLMVRATQALKRTWPRRVEQAVALDAVRCGGRGRGRWLSLGVVLLVVGCSPDADDGALPADLAAMIQGAPAAQQAVVADGEVTFEEYERAAQAVVSCLLEAGVPEAFAEFDPPEVPGLPGGFAFTLAVIDQEGAAEAYAEGEYHDDPSEQIRDDCYDEHVSVVAAVYSYLNTDQRAAEEYMEQLLGEMPQTGG